MAALKKKKAAPKKGSKKGSGVEVPKDLLGLLLFGAALKGASDGPLGLGGLLGGLRPDRLAIFGGVKIHKETGERTPIVGIEINGQRHVMKLDEVDGFKAKLDLAVNEVKAAEAKEAAAGKGPKKGG